VRQRVSGLAGTPVKTGARGGRPSRGSWSGRPRTAAITAH